MALGNRLLIDRLHAMGRATPCGLRRIDRDIVQTTTQCHTHMPDAADASALMRTVRHRVGWSASVRPSPDVADSGALPAGGERRELGTVVAKFQVSVLSGKAW